jgi:hypothetical protein
MDPGFKVAKDRLTILLGSSFEGNYKVKCLLLNHSENPGGPKAT